MSQAAQIILQQLGGSKFTTMVGAKNLGSTPNSLSFKIACKNPKGITHCKITLNSSDLYDMKFYKIRGVNMSTVAEFEGLYNNSLQETFTRATGLDTHL
jgi:hypothetical protein